MCGQDILESVDEVKAPLVGLRLNTMNSLAFEQVDGEDNYKHETL